MYLTCTLGITKRDGGHVFKNGHFDGAVPTVEQRDERASLHRPVGDGSARFKPGPLWQHFAFVHLRVQNHGDKNQGPGPPGLKHKRTFHQSRSDLGTPAPHLSFVGTRSVLRVQTCDDGRCGSSGHAAGLILISMVLHEGVRLKQTHMSKSLLQLTIKSKNNNKS